MHESVRSMLIRKFRLWRRWIDLLPDGVQFTHTAYEDTLIRSIDKMHHAPSNAITKRNDHFRCFFFPGVSSSSQANSLMTMSSSPSLTALLFANVT